MSETYARLNGIAVPIAVASDERRHQATGGLVRTLRGRVVDGRSDAKRAWSLRTTSLPEPEARAAALLAFGVGHVFDFAGGGFHAFSGLGPDRFGHACYFDTVPGWGSRVLVVPAGGSIGWGAQVVDEWTVAMRFLESGRWRHAVVTSQGVWYLDGAETNPLSSGLDSLFAISDGGTFSLRGYDRTGVSAAMRFGELVVLPFALPASMASQLAAWVQPWAPTPLVHLQGGVVEDPLGVYVRGQAPSGSIATRHAGLRLRGAGIAPDPTSPHVIDGDFLASAIEQDLRLVEVDPAPGLFSIPMQLVGTPLKAAWFNGGQHRGAGGGLSDSAGTRTFVTGVDGVIEGAALMQADGLLTGPATAGGSAFSTSGFFRLDSLAAVQTVLSSWDEASGDREWRVRVNTNGSVAVVVSNPAGTASATYTSTAGVVAAGAWRHIGVSFDAAQAAAARVRVAVDGKPLLLTMTTVGSFSGLSNTGSFFCVGQVNPTQELSATVQHVGFWSGAALSPEEMRIAYLANLRGHPLRSA